MLTVIIGSGALGREVARQLAARGEKFRIVQRRPPVKAPEGGEFRAADATDAVSLRAACKGAGSVIGALGFPYDSRIWARAWPLAMQNMLDASAENGARFVFADNLYMYGPQNQPLTEDLPLTGFGRKPRVRAEITRQWLDAHNAGRVEAVAARASDFYGADAENSVLSEYGVKRLSQGKAALVPYSPNHPHDFTYIPDFARALLDLRDAPADACGQAWHAPNAPTRRLRDHLADAAGMLGVAPNLSVLPGPVVALLGLFDRTLFELREMSFQTDRPYLVDSSKFSNRFGWRATPFAEGLAACVEAVRR